MKKIKTKFKDLCVFESQKFEDSRGFFRELVLENKLNSKLIFYVTSKSKKNVVRGLHFQRKRSQGKYLSVIKGKIFDVVVDYRKNSSTFGKHFEIELSDKNCKSIFIPPGFAHGFVGLEKENIVVYGCTNYRDEKSECGIIWNDPHLKIKWPVKKPLLSKKDINNKPFRFYFK
tara:strand:- start:78 stop:596 length:519 start_codon:yes stop_codon:yes gene_type:complete